MPLFEYTCRDCDHTFESLVFGDETPVCPRCESRTLEKLLSTFAVSGESSGPGLADGPPPCGTCGDPGGPGACTLN